MRSCSVQRWKFCLEIEWNCIPVNLNSCDDILETLEAEARKNDVEASFSLLSGIGTYMLQKWSKNGVAIF